MGLNLGGFFGREANMHRLTEWRIVWKQRPYNYSTANVLFVHAVDMATACKVAANTIERTHGIAFGCHLGAGIVDAAPVAADLLTKDHT